MSLSVSALINVTVSLAPISAAARTFNILMIAGDSNVINGLQRFRTYLSYEGVIADFGVDAPESGAAQLYFSQKPQPQTLMIGRWFSSASTAENIGGLLTTTEEDISNWNTISNGSMVIVVDGVTNTLTGLDFTSTTNLNGVASIITAALSVGTCTWNGMNFVVSSGATGAGVAATGSVTLTGQPSYGAQATGNITLTGNPSNNDTVTVNGITVTFVSGTPSGNEVAIGLSDTATALNLVTFLQGSASSDIAEAYYILNGLVITVTARAYSTSGNSFTLAKSSSAITVSAADLSGGANPDTLTLQSYEYIFTPNQQGAGYVEVGATTADTAANLYQAIAATGGDVGEATFSLSGLVITATYGSVGTAGNAYTLAKSGSNITISGATLSGGVDAASVGYATAEGSGTDVSAQLMLTASTSQGLVAGFDEETPVECAAVLANMSTIWYGLMFQASVQPTDDQSLDVSAFVEALTVTRIYGVTITTTGVLSSTVTNDLASLMEAAGYDQSFSQYSENVYAIASLFGRMFSVNFLGTNTTITLMYKQEPGVTAESIDAQEAATLQAKNCNVFAQYDNDTTIIQYGVCASGQYIDCIQGADWFQNDVQTDVYNVLYTTPTKVPQTDGGVNQLVTAIASACTDAVTNGWAAPGVWNGPSFGQLQTGQYLKTGYYIYAQSVALQSESDRQARVAPPMQVAIKLAGAIHTADILIDVND